jgi:hypothetical protein
MPTCIVHLPNGDVIHRPGTTWENRGSNAVSFPIQAEPPRRNPAFDPSKRPGRENPIVLPPSYFVRQSDGSLEYKPRLANGPAPVVFLPPGASVTLPREHDRAIQALDDLGRVCGGLAPNLCRVGADGEPEKRELHPALVEPVSRPVDTADLHARIMRRVGASQ